MLALVVKMAHRDKGPMNQYSMFMLVYYIFFHEITKARNYV